MILTIEQVKWNAGVATGTFKDLVDDAFTAGAPDGSVTTLLAAGPRLLIGRGEHPGRTTGTCIVFGTRPKNLPAGIPGSIWYAPSGRLNGMLSIHVDDFSIIWDLVTHSDLISPRSIRIEVKDTDASKGQGILVHGMAVIG